MKFDLDRAVQKYEQKLHIQFDGSAREADIPTMVTLYRAKAAVMVTDLNAAKGWLNDNGTEVAMHGFYMNAVRFCRAAMDNGLGGDPLKESVNAFLAAQVIKIGASFVLADAQALVFAVLGVPLV